jgi:hypothetical protein
MSSKNFRHKHSIEIPNNLYIKNNNLKNNKVYLSINPEKEYQ